MLFITLESSEISVPGVKIPAKNLEDNTYFVSDLLAGRNLSWWLAGTSMAATTFSIDTPLYICGIVASRGIVGNWEWWSFGISNIFNENQCFPVSQNVRIPSLEFNFFVDPLLDHPILARTLGLKKESLDPWSQIGSI